MAYLMERSPLRLKERRQKDNNMIACGDEASNLYILRLVGFDITSLAQGNEAVPEEAAERA